MELKLHSPVGAEPVTYPWPGTERLNTEDEIKATIKWVCTDFPDLKIPLEHNVLSKIEEAMDYESMKMLCDRFNRAVDTAAALRTNHSKSLASEDLLKHILLQVYVLSVTEPSELNQYEPFSPEVYGETSFDLISKMISLINITEEDTFIDLGSGIGQVVLQMAAATKCKECIGIEKADVPCRYADAMEIQFKKWMAWFGKSYGNYTLIKGDFLSEEHRNKITSSSIVFCNNYAFGPTVDHMLKERFADLKDGARIVSSKSFCSLNFRITDRNLSDIGTIMHVSEMEPLQGSVSWTGKPVSFYLHVIDRTKLERYFQKMKNQPRGRDTSANNSIYGSVENTDNESSRHVGSKNSDNTSDEESTDNGSPPRFSRVTTRRAWSDYVKSKSSGDEDSNYASSNSNRPKRILPRTSKSLAVTPANMPAAQKTTASRKKSAKGRRTKPKRPVKISGALDLLHNETLLSTSPEKVGRKPPPAPGCVDQQLTSITSLEGAVHEELEIPPAPAQTPYGLQILLNRMRDEMLAFIDKMKNPSYAQEIERLIEEERQKKNFILKQKAQLERQINFLTEDSVTHLKARVFEIGIYGDVTVDKIFKHARDIVLEHKKLQSACAKLSEHVMKLEEEQAKLVQERCNELRIQMGISGPLHKEHIMNELIRLTANKHKLMKHSATLSLQISNLEKHNEVMMKRLKEQVRLERPVVKASPVIQQTERKSDTEKHWQERRMPYAKEEPRIGFTANKVYESPRVANFEERLKNIITTALKEDTPPRSVISEMNKTSPTKSRLPTNQESPGKLALRRHLSQEKNTPPKIKPTPRPRTIGDLVNVEIERSFEKDYASTSKSHINPIIDTGHPVRGGNLMSHQSSGSGDPYEFPRFEVKEEPVEGLAASLHESLFSGEVKDELPDGKADKLKRAVSDEELFPSKRFELEGPSALSPAEGEKWKDKVSSSFDRIVAFASTVDTEKRRRSTEGGHMSSPDAEADGNGKGSRYSERDTPPVLEPLQGISPSPPPSSPLPLLPLDGPYSPVNKPQPTNSNHKHFKKFFQRNWKLQK